MKRKPAGKNQKLIVEYLNKVGTATAVEISKGTKIRSNIYTILSKMCDNKQITKNGKYYEVPVITQTYDEWAKTQPEVKANPNESLIRTLIKELEYVQDGITTLQTTKNYLVRRIEFLQNA